MVNYECEICNYITIRKSNYSKHLKTKKHLSNYNNSEEEEKKSSKKDHFRTIFDYKRDHFRTTKRPF